MKNKAHFTLFTVFCCLVLAAPGGVGAAQKAPAKKPAAKPAAKAKAPVKKAPATGPLLTVTANANVATQNKKTKGRTAGDTVSAPSVALSYKPEARRPEQFTLNLDSALFSKTKTSSKTQAALAFKTSLGRAGEVKAGVTHVRYSRNPAKNDTVWDLGLKTRLGQSSTTQFALAYSRNPVGAVTDSNEEEVSEEEESCYEDYYDSAAQDAAGNPILTDPADPASDFVTWWQQDYDAAYDAEYAQLCADNGGALDPATDTCTLPAGALVSEEDLDLDADEAATLAADDAAAAACASSDPVRTTTRRITGDRWKIGLKHTYEMDKQWRLVWQAKGDLKEVPGQYASKDVDTWTGLFGVEKRARGGGKFSLSYSMTRAESKVANRLNPPDTSHRLKKWEARWTNRFLKPNVQATVGAWVGEKNYSTSNLFAADRDTGYAGDKNAGRHDRLFAVDLGLSYAPRPNQKWTLGYVVGSTRNRFANSTHFTNSHNRLTVGWERVF